MSLARRLASAALFLITLIACRDDPARPPDAATAPPPATPALPLPHDLEPVELPDLSRTEPAVAEQLRQRHRAVEELLASDPPDAELARALGDLGRLLHAYGLRPAAAAAYRNAQRLAPEAFEWPYYLGALEADAGRPESAETHLRRALELRPEDLATSLRLAEALRQQNRLDDADALYRQVLERHPRAAAAHAGRGRLAADRGDDRAAVRHFRAALELQPGASQIHYLLAQSHRRLGDAEAAEHALERYGPVPVSFPDPLLRQLDRLKTGVAAHLRAAGQALVDGRYDDALGAYRRALELDPADVEARRLYALALGVGDVEAAEREYREAIRRAPDDPALPLGLGRLLAHKGSPERALAPLRSALERDPGLAEARLLLGETLYRLGRHEEAAAELETALERDPTNGGARLLRALALAALGRLESAERELETALERDPEHHRARLELARVRSFQGKAEGAERELRAVARSDAEPELRAQAHLGLGYLENERGKAAAARQGFERALELDPGLAEAHRAAAELALRGGRFRDAREHLEAALALDARDLDAAGQLARLLATAPDPALRDGTRAHRLAFQAFEARRSPDDAETVAMALAEMGRFDEAIAWQEALLAEAGRSRDPDLAPRLRANLERYRARQGALGYNARPGGSR